MGTEQRGRLRIHRNFGGGIIDFGKKMVTAMGVKIPFDELTDEQRAALGQELKSEGREATASGIGPEVVSSDGV